MKKSEFLTIGALAPLAAEIGGQTIYALSQGMGWASVPMGIANGAKDYIIGIVLVGQGLVDSAQHHSLQPLWNQYYFWNDTPQTLSPAATAVKAGAYIALPSFSNLVIDKGDQLLRKVKRTFRQTTRNRSAS